MLTLSSLPLVLLFLVLVLEVKIICSKEISSKDTEEEEHNRRETVANFPTFQNLQGFAQLNTSHAGRNDVYNSDRPDHPLPDSISTDSLYFYTCPFYSASQTSSATSDGTPKCMFYMNGGTQVTVTSCGESESGGYCSGDQYLRLTDAYGNQLASSDDACGDCSRLEYTSSWGSPASLLYIWQGCYSSNSCSGVVVIISSNILPSSISSSSPTEALTEAVTRARASYDYYSDGDYYFHCDYYSASNTNSASSYATTPQCYIASWGGYTLSLGSCSSYSYGSVSSYCSGNQVLRLLDSSGNEVARSSATCGGCAELTYTVPTYSSCQTYSIWEGCDSTGSCGGQVGIRMYVAKLMPTIAPSPSPSPWPSRRPSRRFTRSPTMAPSADALTKLVFTLSVSVQDGYSRSDDLAQSIWVQSLADVLGIPSSEVTFISISTFDSTSGRTDAVPLADGNTAVTLQVSMMLSDLSLPYGATLDDALDEVNSDISWLESSSGLQSLQNTLISVANSVGDSSFSVSVTDLQCSTVVISTPVDGNDDDGDGGDGGSMDVVFYVLVVLVPIVGVSVLCMLCWWLWHKYGNGSSSPPVVVGDQQQDVSSQAAAGSNNNNNNNGNIDQNMARDLESAPVVALELVTIQPGAEGNLSTGVMVLAIPIDILPDHKLPSAPPLP